MHSKHSIRNMYFVGVRRKSGFSAGFTLIELLVVISIISLLSTVVLASLNSVRAKARDATRKQHLTQISKALTLNYDKHGGYTQPEAWCIDYSIGAGGGGIGCAGWTEIGDWHAQSDLRDLITDGFLSELPRDPINNTTYFYSYEPYNASECSNARAGCGYVLCARMETEPTFCIRDDRLTNY